MTDRVVRLVTAAIAVSIVVALAIAAGTGDVRTIINPRILPRTLIGAGAFAVAATVWAVAGIRSPGALRIGAITPLLVPLILLPAALQSTSGEYSQIRLFTAGGSGAVASRTPAHTGAVISAAPGGGREADAPGADGDWVDDANPDLLAAVAAAAADQALDAPAVTTTTGADGRTTDAERLAEIEALANSSQPIIIDSDTFSRRVNLIWDDPTAFRDHRVSVTGFVYRRDDWPVDTFVVARLSIWCCVADAAVVGLMARADRAVAAPPSGEWIEIEGRIEVRPEFVTETVAMSDVPQMRDLAWRRIAPPRHEYVFPE